MPIVVRELVVRASVEEAEESNTCTTPSENESDRQSTGGDTNTENIVAICVEKVMQALELKKER
jgi:hypothetical protein